MSKLKYIPLANFVKNLITEGSKAKVTDTVKFQLIATLKKLHGLGCSKNDDEDIITLVSAFNKDNKSLSNRILRFCWWVRDSGLNSKVELRTYIIYQNYLNELNKDKKLEVEAIPLDKFNGYATPLVDKIRGLCKDWSKVENTEASVVSDFFKFAFPLMYKKQSYYVTSPKLLLGSFGWDLFVQTVSERYDGAFNTYFIPNASESKELKQEDNMLSVIQELRDSLMSKGRIKDIDAVNSLITSKGLKEAFKILVSKKIVKGLS